MDIDIDSVVAVKKATDDRTGNPYAIYDGGGFRRITNCDAYGCPHYRTACAHLHDPCVVFVTGFAPVVDDNGNLSQMDSLGSSHVVGSLWAKDDGNLARFWKIFRDLAWMWRIPIGHV